MKISSLGKLTLGCAMALISGAALANVTPNLTDGSGNPVKDGSGACVVTSGIVHPDCAGVKAAPAATPAAPSAPAAPASPAAPAAPATPAPSAKPAPSSVRQAVVIQADALFDFDKSVLRPDGRKSIDDAMGKLRGVDLEMVIATGHTDSVGSDAYNQRLSERRAAAVKEYLASKGIASSKITTIGKGESQPVATNKTAEGRQKNRRVDIEFKGVRQ
jgi:OOP family OmpA-OmpF porin